MSQVTFHNVLSYMNQLAYKYNDTNDGRRHSIILHLFKLRPCNIKVLSFLMWIVTSRLQEDTVLQQATNFSDNT